MGAPCQTGCPVGTETWRYVAHIAHGEYEEAYRAIRAMNPFPSACARICSRQCEGQCRCGTTGGEPIAIRTLKRFVVDRVDPSTFKYAIQTKLNAPRVAVIGAGLSGLLCARTLHDQGVDVRLFDKGRGPGGRLATRRAEGFAFDHGAQFFTVRDPRLGRLVESWRAQGLVAEWRPRLVEIALEESGRRVTPLQLEHPRWVAVPGMSALARHLADGLDLRAPVRVTRLERAGAQWRLWDEDADSPALDLGLFDRVALALPPAQAAALLEPVPALAKTVAQVQLDPCIAVLAGFERPLELGFDAARIQGGPLSWVARNSSKPGRGPGEAWVLHAAPGWSRTFLEGTPEVQGPALLQAFAQVAGRALPAPSLVQVHRWRYAQAPAAPLGTACLFDPDTGLGACGDWCGTPRVEGAVLSGLALAGRFLES